MIFKIVILGKVCWLVPQTFIRCIGYIWDGGCIFLYKKPPIRSKIFGFHSLVVSFISFNYGYYINSIDFWHLSAKLCVNLFVQDSFPCMFVWSRWMLILSNFAIAGVIKIEGYVPKGSGSKVFVKLCFAESESEIITKFLLVLCLSQ